MKFKDLAIYLDKLEKTSSRNEMTVILADLLKKLSADEIDKTVYLVLGQLAANYEGIVLNLAEKMMFRVIAKAYSVTAEKAKELFKQKGDIGVVAQSLAKEKKSSLDVNEVLERLLDIAKDSGEGSQERKVEKMADLLSNLDPLSARFVSRIPLGRLRLGFSDKTVIDALSWMAKGDKSVKNQIEKAYQVLPDPGILAKNIKEKGLEKATKNVFPQVGVPVLPMLAQRLKSPKEMIVKMGRKVSVEPKLDGLRLSIHFKKGKNGFIKAYTRNLNETSWMFPELKNIGSQIKADEVILDSEAVGLDEETKKMVDFQTTMTRRRKHEIEKAALKTGIEFFVFDIVFKDGQNLMEKSYLERRGELEATLTSGKILRLIDYELTDNPEKINAFYQEKVKQGYEGIIVKNTEGYYVPGRTGWRWVKMKQVESAKSRLSDTIDCLVMGYTVGKGKRTGFGVGQFLVGVLDPTSRKASRGEGNYKTVTKIGTGLTDEQFRELKKRLVPLEVKEKPKEYEVSKLLIPDYWVYPKLVVEIAADEITKSPSHTAGLALRFPRLVRFRDDRKPEDTTTLAELKKLYEMQRK
jgi:DNA ligase-1